LIEKDISLFIERVLQEIKLFTLFHYIISQLFQADLSMLSDFDSIKDPLNIVNKNKTKGTRAQGEANEEKKDHL
jgi:hypothetical protein